jgi:hypothetical protein
MTTGLLLVQYTADGTVRAGVRHDDVVRALPRNWPDTVLAILDSWDDWSGPLRVLPPDALPVVPDARLVAPVTFPRKILCAGAARSRPGRCPAARPRTMTGRASWPS